MIGAVPPDNPQGGVPAVPRQLKLQQRLGAGSRHGVGLLAAIVIGQVLDELHRECQGLVARQRRHRRCGDLQRPGVWSSQLHDPGLRRKQPGEIQDPPGQGGLVGPRGRRGEVLVDGRIRRHRVGQDLRHRSGRQLAGLGLVREDLDGVVGAVPGQGPQRLQPARLRKRRLQQRLDPGDGRGVRPVPGVMGVQVPQQPLRELQGLVRADGLPVHLGRRRQCGLVGPGHGGVLGGPSTLPGDRQVRIHQPPPRCPELGVPGVGGDPLLQGRRPGRIGPPGEVEEDQLNLGLGRGRRAGVVGQHLLQQRQPLGQLLPAHADPRPPGQEGGLRRVRLGGVAGGDLLEDGEGLRGPAHLHQRGRLEGQHLRPLGVGEGLVAKQHLALGERLGIEPLGQHGLDQAELHVHLGQLAAEGLEHLLCVGLVGGQHQRPGPRGDGVVHLPELVVGPAQPEEHLRVAEVRLGGPVQVLAGLLEVALGVGVLSRVEGRLRVGLGPRRRGNHRHQSQCRQKGHSAMHRMCSFRVCSQTGIGCSGAAASVACLFGLSIPHAVPQRM